MSFLGSWILTQFANAVRKWLEDGLRGKEKERALRDAEREAVRLSARELCPEASRAELDHLTRVLDAVIESLGPSCELNHYPTMLQTLEAAISGKLAVLGDETLTGIGQSSAQLLGISVEQVTDVVMRNVVKEILNRGMTGGILSSLADQLNHDLARLQIRDTVQRLDRIEDKLDRYDVQLLAYLEHGAFDFPNKPDLFSPISLSPSQFTVKAASKLYPSPIGVTEDVRNPVERKVENGSPTSWNHEVMWQQCFELEEKLRAIEETHELNVSKREAARGLAADLQRLLLECRDSAYRGRRDESLMHRASNYVDRLVAIDSRWKILYRERAAAAAAYCHFLNQAHDLMSLFEADMISARDLCALASSLQQLGEYVTAARMLDWIIIQLQIDPLVASMDVPSISEERRLLTVKTSLHRAWIQHDMGDPFGAFHRCQMLIGTSRSPGDALELGISTLQADVLHRQGRILVNEVVSFRSLSSPPPGKFFERGIAKLQAAEKLQDYHPYHPLALGRAYASRPRAEANHDWASMGRELMSFGAPLIAHVELTNGQLARRAGAYLSAISHLEEALNIWRNMPFPQGAMNASWELAQCYLSSGRFEDMRRALDYLGLCAVLASRLCDPIKDRVIQQRDLLASRLGQTNRSELLARVSQHYPLLIERVDLPSRLTRAFD